MTARAALLAAALAAVGLTGCTGSTEPASDVTSNAATLNARGTADDGPASSFFRWAAVLGGAEQTTVTRRWPAGASGPVRERITGLSPQTVYRFTACGADDGEAATCAQTRYLATRGPAGRDSVKGFWTYRIGGAAQPTGNVDASAGPDGESPRGSLSFGIGYSYEGETYVRFTGFVTCVAVQGNRATIGAVGQDTGSAAGDGAPVPATGLFTVVDRVRSGEDQQNLLAASSSPGSTRPDCSRGPAPTDSPAASVVVVTDEP